MRHGHPTMHDFVYNQLTHESIFGESLLLIKYYKFNDGDFSGACVLQGNSFGEASGSAVF